LNGEIKYEQVYKGEKESTNIHRYKRTEKKRDFLERKLIAKMSLYDDMTNLNTL